MRIFIVMSHGTAFTAIRIMDRMVILASVGKTH